MYQLAGRRPKEILCVTALDNTLFFSLKVSMVFFSLQNHMLCVHRKGLAEVFLKVTHNIRFHGEIRKLFTESPSLSRAMHVIVNELHHENMLI